MGDWIETTIGEFCPFKYGKGLKETNRQQGDVPVFGSNGIVGCHNQAIVESKGVIIGRKGTVGAVHYSDKPFCPIDTTFYVAESPDKDIRYIYFLLKSVGLEHMNSDSAVPGLNRTAAHSRIIEVPKSLEEQRAIAGILGALDDKIEVNRRMNATLESMARAVFRQWFVENEEVGYWDVGNVIQDFNLTMGQSPPGETYNEDSIGIPFFQGRADFEFRFPSKRVYCTAPTRFANPGDTLVCVRAPVGDINMASEKCAIGRGVAAIRHKTRSRSYTYYTMQFLEEDFKQFEAGGTVFGSINKTDFQNLKVVIPPSAIVEKFEEICFPIDQMIENNEKESRTLASLRDGLLPKLMRGKVRVKDVEKIL
jgi:type I restriction enzyme S subunit